MQTMTVSTKNSLALVVDPFSISAETESPGFMTVKNENRKSAMNLVSDDDADDKGSEPESAEVAKWVQNILFVGLETN
jgi:hypothetical protein